MAISVRLYGEFREIAPELDKVSESIGILDVEAEKASTTGDLLEELKLEPTQVSHVFVNGTYSSFKKDLEDEDEVALFPTDMGLLYHWYFEEED